MSNLGKLIINPEKLMNSDQLIQLKGGEDNPCGTGFTSINCSYQPTVNSAWVGPYTVCVGAGQDPCTLMSNAYPNAADIRCDGEATPIEG